MTQAELEKVMNAMFVKHYKAIGFDRDDPHCIRPTDEQHALVKKRIKAEIKAKGENDLEFREAYLLHIANVATESDWEARCRPTGEYQKDAFLPLGAHRLVAMWGATREQLISWALMEPDERNLAYIKSRLDLWDAHPECKKLEELEAAISKQSLPTHEGSRTED
jgi:hypothetical protein